MHKKKRASKYNSPESAVTLGCTLLILAWVMIYGWKLDFEEKADLYRINGVVTSFKRTHAPKSGIKIHIYLSNGSRDHHLTQDDLSQSFPSLLTLSKGDKISALVASDTLGRNLEWVWEIERNGEFILRYKDTLNHLYQDAERMTPFGFAALFLAGLFIFVGFYLRLSRGAWS